jgi:hypothetical protein
MHRVAWAGYAENRRQKVESRFHKKELDRKVYFLLSPDHFLFAKWDSSPIGKAEDKGFEPSTGFPAPDFESGS